MTAAEHLIAALSDYRLNANLTYRALAEHMTRHGYPIAYQTLYLILTDRSSPYERTLSMIERYLESVGRPVHRRTAKATLVP